MENGIKKKESLIIGTFLDRKYAKMKILPDKF